LTDGGIVVWAIVLDTMDGSVVCARVERNPDKLVGLLPTSQRVLR
jgi:hypothetical protein